MRKIGWTLPLCLFLATLPAEEKPAVVRGRSPAPLSTLPAAWPRYPLQADRSWQLDLPAGQRFDASALLLRPDGALLTVNDRGASVYQVMLSDGSGSLQKVPGLFEPSFLRELDPAHPGQFDVEGLAQDPEGRIYICEEGRRWILRCDPRTRAVDRLEIDWSPVKKHFHPLDGNASFEGIAIGDGKLFVANERQMGRLIVVDLKTLNILDDFVARPSNGRVGDIHYSDLSWFNGSLYALLRHHRVVLKIDPSTHQVLAEYQFREVEDAPDVAYRRLYPTGTMEGLAVDAKHIWLLTDNNGKGRVKHPKDLRPTLFRCPKPD